MFLNHLQSPKSKPFLQIVKKKNHFHQLRGDKIPTEKKWELQNRPELDFGRFLSMYV